MLFSISVIAYTLIHLYSSYQYLKHSPVCTQRHARDVNKLGIVRALARRKLGPRDTSRFAKTTKTLLWPRKREWQRRWKCGNSSNKESKKLQDKWIKSWRNTDLHIRALEKILVSWTRYTNWIKEIRTYAYIWQIRTYTYIWQIRAYTYIW